MDASEDQRKFVRSYLWRKLHREPTDIDIIESFFSLMYIGRAYAKYKQKIILKNHLVKDKIKPIV